MSRKNKKFRGTKKDDEFVLSDGDMAFGRRGDDHFEFKGPGTAFMSGGNGNDVYTIGDGGGTTFILAGKDDIIILNGGTWSLPSYEDGFAWSTAEDGSVAVWREYGDGINSVGRSRRELGDLEEDFYDFIT